MIPTWVFSFFPDPMLQSDWSIFIIARAFGCDFWFRNFPTKIRLIAPTFQAEIRGLHSWDLGKISWKIILFCLLKSVPRWYQAHSVSYQSHIAWLVPAQTQFCTILPSTRHFSRENSIFRPRFRHFFQKVTRSNFKSKFEFPVKIKFLNFYWLIGSHIMSYLLSFDTKAVREHKTSRKGSYIPRASSNSEFEL